MRTNLKLWILCLSLCAYQTLAVPVTDKDSLVVSSTESPKENNEAEDASSKENAVPSVPKIYEMKVDTNVSNRFAKTAVTSKVKNLAKTAQEATFSVVLPETAYISGFVMEIDGKSYKAYVKEKEEAKQIYTEAIDRGQAAAHVEANARDSNRFTVSVNVEPQSKAVFTLTYEELLQRQDGQYEVVINIHPGQPVKDLQVQVHINESRPLRFVRAPPLRSGNAVSEGDAGALSPQAQVEVGNATAATVRFSPDAERQKQLAAALGTRAEDGLAGQFVVQYDVERDPSGGGEVLVGEDGYFVHFFAPEELAPLPKQVVFVLDTSGSMDGIRIKQLKEAMNSILSELKPEDIFNIVEFSSTVRVWNVPKVEVQYELGDDPWSSYRDPEVPVKNKTNQVLPPAFEANEENVNKAKQVVDKLNAYGGTDIKSALEVGLKLVKKNKEERKDSQHQPIVVFLTDGEPTVGETNTESIISSVSDSNGATAAPIFSLSFGDGADRAFLQRLSLKNAAFARHIYEAADASLQLRHFYRQISSPLLADVRFEYAAGAAALTRHRFPIFFGGGELVVAGAGAPAAACVARGATGELRLEAAPPRPAAGLERLWAYLTVRQLLQARDAAADKDKGAAGKRALELALRYEFVTAVSSLVVVRPNDTRAVDTEDASKSTDRPYFLNKKYAALGGVGFGPTFSLASPLNSVPVAQHELSSAAFYPPSTRSPQPSVLLPVPVAETVEEDIAFETFESTPLSTTQLPDKFEDLKTKLPWLNDNLNENYTLTTPQGDYELSLDATVANTTECPKTPGNGTTGICTLLPKCPQVFTLLTDLEVFKEYFCPLDTYVGICCPVTEES